MKKTVLVTGVNGFIGSNVARVLGADCRVVGIGRSAGKPDDSLDGYRQMALPDPGLADLLRDLRPDAVIHCAGRGSVPFSINNPAADFDAGPRLVTHVLDAMRLAGIRARFFFPSSAAVYGNPKSLPVAETSPLQPISPYGYHKVLSESIIQQYCQLYGQEYVILRVFSCYGEGLAKQLLWDAAVKATEGTLELFGTGEETRDFIHVHDLAHVVSLLIAQETANAVLNVAGGRQVSVREIVELLVRKLELDVPVHFNGQVRTGDPLRWQADISRLKSLGGGTSLSLEEGVQRFAEWFWAVRNTQGQGGLRLVGR
ncbi:NAD-dependent epimerase/dehydratase family protein [Desulfovibrio mangrovi]|uniref:NAD-dependent epimerase/dehydratase family protein n=1 Tax=Desulfovibrio mangrovi TaxID=2976983 RepID=UPI0022480E2B|nr:NAD-dependent epimerase/dehydratase family protein [Desulfovibrio mangrovi]UZP66891.1 NAD-dependent epimerase/dehydratase family protein [Desulfovibrio mangrovi]